VACAGLSGNGANGCLFSDWEFDMNKPHKHAELIKQWADGAEIEYLRDSEQMQEKDRGWVASPMPSWRNDGVYRVAHPKLTKFVVSLTKTIEVIVEATSPEEAFQQAYKADKYNNKAWLETRCSKSCTEPYKESK
jgi:hypothetical protein